MVYDEFLVICTKDVLIDIVNDILLSEMKMLSSVDSTHHLAFLLATRWTTVHLTCQKIFFLSDSDRRLKTFVRISWLNK